MNLSQKKTEKIAEIIMAFIINAFLFGIASMFTEMTFKSSMFYSVINSIWMPFFLFPNLSKIENIFKKEKKSYKLKPLLDYFESFEERQEKIQLEVKELEKEEKTFLEKYKFDWKLYRKFLKRNKVEYLYHFTDKSNLKSIINSNGLYSWKYCLENNIIIDKPGGDDLSRKLDTYANLENFIRLSFTPNHPMMYYALKKNRISNPIILKLDIELIYWLNSKYSDGNATSKNSKIGNNYESLSIIDFKALRKTDYLNAPIEKKKYFQAEVMIKEHIPKKYIKEIYEYNE